MNASKKTMPTVWTDSNDAPELTDAFFEEADEYVGDKLVRRGHQKSKPMKQALTVRYDIEVIEAFKATGDGWQNRMNAVLKDWVKAHSLA